MTAQVKVLPSGHAFHVAGQESILEAGLRGGHALDYGCSNGNCGRCTVRVISGETRSIRHHDYALSEAAKSQGIVLGCCHTAVSDLVIEAEEAKGAADIPVQALTVRIRKIQTPGSGVIIANARTPRTRRLRFLAGQSAALTLPGSETRTYPIASCPCDDMNLEFHIPADESDPVAHWLRTARHTDTLALSGPFGDFVLNENSPNAVVFVAEGAGFGPIKGLIEHAMSLDIAPRIALVWIADSPDGHYMHNLCRAWADAIDEFAYVPIAQPASLDELTGTVIAAIRSAKGCESNHAVDVYGAVETDVQAALTLQFDAEGITQGQVHWRK